MEQNSGTHDFAGVKAVADLLAPEFEQLGFEVEWKPMAAAGRAGHLVAVHRGNGQGKRILLIGHLDTVFEADDPFTGFERDGDEAVGPGVGDDKGGDVVMLAALRALQAAGALRDADIEVVLSGDEEDVGSPVAVARADLIAAGRRADIALDFENLSHGHGRDMGSIARRSSNTWVLTVRGESGHSSGIFSDELGDGAIFELARILAAFRAKLPEPNLTFNVGLAGGGQAAEFDAGKTRLRASGKDNIVPPIALARGDFRTLDVEQTRRVETKMQAIVARHPAVRSVAVYAVPDDPVGDRVMVALELHPGATLDPEELDRFLHDQPDLGPKWVPAFVRVDDDLPKLSSLKIDKKALRAAAWRTPGVVWRPARGDGLRPLTAADRAALDPLLGAS